MAITASKRKFLNHCKSLILGPVDHLPTFVEFYNSLPGTNEEISQGTFTEMLNHIENMPDFDMVLDPEVDKFAQRYINMAIGAEGPRVTPNEYSDGSEVPDPSTFEQPKAEAPKKERKAKKAIQKGFENSAARKGTSVIEFVSTCNSGWKLSPGASNEWMVEHMFKAYPLGDLKNI